MTKRNSIFKKVSTILFALMITISMVIPSVLMPQKAEAASSSFTPQMATQMKSYLGQSMTCDAYAGIVGRSIYNLSGFPSGNVTAEHTWLKNNAEYVGSTTDPTTFNFKAGDIIVTNGDSHIGFILTSGVGGTIIHGGITYGPYHKQVVSDSVASWWKGSKDIYGSSGAGAASISVYRVFKDEGYAQIQKSTKGNTHLTALNKENYQLAGTQYGLFSDSAATKRVGTLKTDATGVSNAIKVVAGTYYVKEEIAPAGHLLDSKIYPLTVTAGKTTKLQVSDPPIVNDLNWKVIRKTIEKGADKNLSVAGAEFTVKYYGTLTDVSGKTPVKTWTFITNDDGEIAWEDSFLKKGSDPLFKDDKGKPTGLLGTYVIEETKAPKGLAKYEHPVYVRVSQAGMGSAKTLISFSEDPTFKNPTIVNQNGTAWVIEEKTQKINLQLQKIDSETNKPVPQGFGSFEGAEFSVWYFDPLLNEDVNVGKIVTDENGFGSLNNLRPGLYTIKEEKAPAGYLDADDQVIKVEARVKEVNTAFFDYKSDVKEKPITVEVHKTSFKSEDKSDRDVTVNVKGAKLALFTEDGTKLDEWVTDDKAPHTLKALPVGNYVIKEFESPKGYLPLEEDFKFSVEKKALQEFNVFNEPQPVLKTSAFFDNDFKNSLNIDGIKATDTVYFKDVMKGHPYTAKGEVVNKDTGKVIATGETKFTPEKSKGKVEVKFTFNAKDLKGSTLVVTEKFYRDDRKSADKEVSKHIDLEDKSQTIYFPSIKTLAYDKIDKEKDILGREKQTIVDEVGYTNLAPGQEYTIKGELKDKKTGKSLGIKAETTFTAATTDGSVNLEYNFLADKLAGKTVVVYETLFEKDTEIANHKDLLDLKQTVYFPEIKTKATDKIDNGKDVFANEKQVIVDTVKYSNLIEGRNYKMTGTLMDKETGKPVMENGKEITAEKEFVAEKANGTVELEFVIENAKTLEGKTTVAFENLYRDKKLVAVHADIEDKDQSVHFPKIRTTLTENKTESKEIHAIEKVKLTDVVKYENLLKGEKYIAKGVVIDKVTKEELAKAEKEFTAEDVNGSVKLDFELNAKDLKGKDLVCFEELYRIGEKDVQSEDPQNPTTEKEKTEKLIAIHKDINDEGQTVGVVEPEVKTTATVNGAKKATAANNMTIVDKVEYKDLVIGKEYTIKGKLMDKGTNKPLLIDGKEVTSELTFTADKKDGFKDLVFKFDGSKLGGKTLVVFEDIYQDGNLIATHADINDVAQTIDIEKVPPTPKTGYDNPFNTLPLVMTIAFGTLSTLLIKRKYKNENL